MTAYSKIQESKSFANLGTVNENHVLRAKFTI